MGKMEFTPGPLECKNDTFIMKDDEFLAQCFPCQIEEEMSANAALMKEAPVMYYCICDALADLQMPDGMRAHFEEVLRKARGEE